MCQYKIGDLVRLKTPMQGRNFKGRIIRINKITKGLYEVTIVLPNGLYSTFTDDLIMKVEDKD